MISEVFWVVGKLENHKSLIPARMVNEMSQAGYIVHQIYDQRTVIFDFRFFLELLVKLENPPRTNERIVILSWLFQKRPENQNTKICP